MLQCSDAKQVQWLADGGCQTITTLSSTDSATVSDKAQEPGPEAVSAAVSETTSLLMDLSL